jgi:type I restriction enzyme S subunit
MPAAWKRIRLGDVCTKIGSGATPRGGNDVYLASGPYALIRSQNVYNDGFHHDGLAFIGEEHASDLVNVEVLEDDVLLNITGDSVARACQVDRSVLPARVNQHVAIIRPEPDRLDPRFLRYFLVSPEMQAKMLSWAGSGGTRNALTKGMIESFDVPAPEDVNEQRTIAYILGTLDDKIELNRRMNETLETMARALFKSWFVDFDPVRAKAEGRDPGLPQPLADLFPDSFEDSELGEIPRGWGVGPLDSVLVLQRGFDLPATQRTSGKYPVLAASGPSGTHNEFMVRGPGVTTGRSGVLGRVFYVDDDFWPLNTSLWVKEFRHSMPAYAFHLLRGFDLETFNAGSAVPTLNRNHVHNLPTLLPPMAFIAAFERFATGSLERGRNNDDQSETLAILRDTLLPTLISGELRIASVRTVAEIVSRGALS